MAHRIGLSGRTAAGEVLLAPAVHIDALGVCRRRVKVCACREYSAARDEQAGDDPGSVVLLHVCLLRNTVRHTPVARLPDPEMLRCARLSAARPIEHLS